MILHGFNHFAHARGIWSSRSDHFYGSLNGFSPRTQVELRKFQNPPRSSISTFQHPPPVRTFKIKTPFSPTGNITRLQTSKSDGLDPRPNGRWYSFCGSCTQEDVCVLRWFFEHFEQCVCGLPLQTICFRDQKDFRFCFCPLKKDWTQKRFPLDLTPQQPFTQVADGEIDTFPIPERSKATVLQINPSDQVQIRMSVFEHPFSKLTSGVRLPLAHQVWTSIWIPKEHGQFYGQTCLSHPLWTHEQQGVWNPSLCHGIHQV